MKSKSFTSYLSKGYLVYPGNFILEKRIKTLNQFWDAIINEKSIYARHKMYPTAFFFSWNIRLIKEWIEADMFWIVRPFN